jgi:hypothetical protein
MGLDKNLWRIQELEQQLVEAHRLICSQNTAMRNALIYLDDGDEDEARGYLLQFVGDQYNDTHNKY